MISLYIRNAGRLGILAAIGLGRFPAGSQASLSPAADKGAYVSFRTIRISGV
jgi:hypothetical protein